MDVIEKKAANFLVARENGVDTNSANWIGGSATLTPTGLTISANAINALVGGKSSSRSLDLHSISKIDHEASFGMDVLTFYVGDNTYKLRCYGAKGFKAQIELAMERSKSNAVAEFSTSKPTVPAAAPPAPTSAAAEAVNATVEVPATRSGDPINKLMPCASCNHIIAVSAVSCPQCGAVNNFVHPKIEAFPKQQFPVPEFAFETTGMTVAGEMQAKSAQMAQKAGICLFVTFIISIFMPLLFWPALIVSLVYVGFAKFSQDQPHSFKVDYSSGDPVWASTDDAVWGPVKSYFLG